MVALSSHNPKVFERLLDAARSSVYAPEFDTKRLKKAEGCIGRNVVDITIRMKTIVQIR